MPRAGPTNPVFVLPSEDDTRSTEEAERDGYEEGHRAGYAEGIEAAAEYLEKEADGFEKGHRYEIALILRDDAASIRALVNKETDNG